MPEPEISSEVSSGQFTLNSISELMLHQGGPKGNNIEEKNLMRLNTNIV
jgi:hypothetical protein